MGCRRSSLMIAASRTPTLLVAAIASMMSSVGATCQSNGDGSTQVLSSGLHCDTAGRVGVPKRACDEVRWDSRCRRWHDSGCGVEPEAVGSRNSISSGTSPMGLSPVAAGMQMPFYSCVFAVLLAFLAAQQYTSTRLSPTLNGATDETRSQVSLFAASKAALGCRHRARAHAAGTQRKCAASDRSLVAVMLVARICSASASCQSGMSGIVGNCEAPNNAGGMGGMPKAPCLDYECSSLSAPRSCCDISGVTWYKSCTSVTDYCDSLSDAGGTAAQASPPPPPPAPSPPPPAPPPPSSPITPTCMACGSNRQRRPTSIYAAASGKSPRQARSLARRLGAIPRWW